MTGIGIIDPASTPIEGRPSLNARLWLPRLVSLLLIAALAAILAWWVPRLAAPTPPIAPIPNDANSLVSDANAAASLFGALPPKAAQAPTLNFKVLGLVSGMRGSALISVDGRPVRSVALGDEVESGWMLVGIKAEQIILQRNGTRTEIAAPPRGAVSLLTGP